MTDDSIAIAILETIALDCSFVDWGIRDKLDGLVHSGRIDPAQLVQGSHKIKARWRFKSGASWTDFSVYEHRISGKLALRWSQSAAGYDDLALVNRDDSSLEEFLYTTLNNYVTGVEVEILSSTVVIAEAEFLRDFAQMLAAETAQRTAGRPCDPTESRVDVCRLHYSGTPTEMRSAINTLWGSSFKDKEITGGPNPLYTVYGWNPSTRRGQAEWQTEIMLTRDYYPKEQPMSSPIYETSTIERLCRGATSLVVFRDTPKGGHYVGEFKDYDALLDAVAEFHDAFASDTHQSPKPGYNPEGVRLGSYTIHRRETAQAGVVDA